MFSKPGPGLPSLPQRAGWTWAEYTTKLGWNGCLCQVTSLRPEQLQKNESYFHNLHINWDWLKYVTCLDTFFDLKLGISEVCLKALLKIIGHTHKSSCLLKILNSTLRKSSINVITEACFLYSKYLGPGLNMELSTFMAILLWKKTANQLFTSIF